MRSLTDCCHVNVQASELRKVIVAPRHATQSNATQRYATLRCVAWRGEGECKPAFGR